jgi:hypothetical protein
MTKPEDPWLSLLLVALFCFLLLLRLAFPNASRRSESLVLATATILFFTICNFLA